jgi:hypothetical protein
MGGRRDHHRDLAREVIRLVGKDVAEGSVPWDVAEYSELHDYVDANEYTLEVIGPFYPDDNEENGPEPVDLTNEVQTRFSEMLSGSTRFPMTPGYDATTSTNWCGESDLESEKTGMMPRPCNRVKPDKARAIASGIWAGAGCGVKCHNSGRTGLTVRYG